MQQARIDFAAKANGVPTIICEEETNALAASNQDKASSLRTSSVVGCARSGTSGGFP